MTTISNDSTTGLSQNPVSYDPPKSEKNDSVAKICAVIATIAITIFGLIASFLAVGIFAPVTLSFEAGLGLTLLGGAAIGTGGYFAAYHFFKLILKTADDSDSPASIEEFDTEDERYDPILSPIREQGKQALRRIEETKKRNIEAKERAANKLLEDVRLFKEDIKKITTEYEQEKLNIEAEKAEKMKELQTPDKEFERNNCDHYFQVRLKGIKTDYQSRKKIYVGNFKLKLQCHKAFQMIDKKEIKELEQKYKKDLEEKKKRRQELIDKYKMEGIEIDRSAEEQYSLV